jgi:AraC family transcriptional regulator, arabinose operon regulatory protein
MPALRGSLFARVTGVESAVPSNGSTPSASVTILPAKPALATERRVRRVLEKIETQLPRSVRELASDVRLSPGHLRRLFQQETGRHLSHVLLERKLRHAANLLATTDMPVKEIAYAVGYGHHSSFVRAFERGLGQSPKDYRSSAQDGVQDEMPLKVASGE